MSCMSETVLRRERCVVLPEIPSARNVQQREHILTVAAALADCVDAKHVRKDLVDIQDHYRMLERMYAGAPINRFFLPSMTVSEGQAVIEMLLNERFHHPAGAVHGSVYFKMLDDAAFFAANSLETEVFVLTTSFTTHFTRPVSGGRLRAVGRVLRKDDTQYAADSVVYDANDREIGRGSGVFVRSRTMLSDISGYGK